ncbi:MAG: hypothetical protein M9887_00125 [Chitinophagales bacterium]|nr:hypothetical protein [Chitinophagales bacterium]
MKWIYSLVLISFSCLTASAQSQEENLLLGQQYLDQNEYEKAVDIYKSLAKESDLFFDIYDNYKKALHYLKDEKLEKSLIEQAYKLSNQNPLYLFDLAQFYLDDDKEKQADKQFKQAISSLKPNTFQIQNIAKNLIQKQQYEWAKQVLQKGKSLLKGNDFDLEIAHIFGLQGNYEAMVQGFLQDIMENPQDLNDVIFLLDKEVEDKANAETLENEIFKVIGKDKQAWSAIDLLVWLYKKQGDYASAFDQVRALDIQRGEDGSQVLEIARLCKREKDYRTATRAFKYLIGKGSEYPYYIVANLELINVQKAIVFDKKKYDQADLLDLKKSYQHFIAQKFNQYNTVLAKIELGELEAKYLFEVDTAIAILKNIVEDRATPKDLLVRAKLDLGDYYIMDGQHWESTLLYTQIEKEYKGTPTGEEAKFRNARLAYFKGDFDWALTRLKVIKANTFELISNDAIELASFISDNYNQDYQEDKAAMKAFSEMDLLFFQNDLSRANQMADSLLILYTGHPLEDDFYFMKAKISRKLQNYDDLEKYLLLIYEKFPKSILADDAVFQLAELYENQLEDKEKAKIFYEKILLEYTDSIFTIDARKRYRLLRGDSI